MTCVPENIPPISELYPHGRRVSNDDPHQCKEGDRRCSRSFNRVDRCNSSREWVTYHDCLKAELCDGNVLECLPLANLNANELKFLGTVTPNGTATMPM
ncbi:hypothetical protein F4801DRAFT_529283 [Xylaria longipes]|nr:hypothetical protein F4801DRAFT_529283 [Xylaria longipes]